MMHSAVARALPLAVTGWEILNEDAQSVDESKMMSGWKPIGIPSTFRVTLRGNETFRHLWLRGTFVINDQPAHYYGISMGRVIISDVTYINGVRVGSRSFNKAGILSLPRGYVIPTAVLKKGMNEVYIHLGMYVHNYGGIMDDVLIQPETDFENTNVVRNFLYRQLPIGIALLYAIIVISLIPAFLANFRQKQLILNIIALMMLVIYIISMYLPISILKPGLSVSFQSALVPVFFVLIMLMFQSVYRIYLSGYNRIIFALFGIMSLVALLWHGTVCHLLVPRIVTIMSIIIFLISFPLMIYRLNRLHPDRFRLIMVMLFSILTGVITALEIISELSGWQSTDLVAIYSTPLFIPIFIVMYAREFLRHQVEVECLYTRLKEAELKGKGITITDSSEEKLNRIISFLEENYRSDISREGLAAAVGLNANYMGTLFKTYTGKKINDFINELRIREATLRLEKNDEKIIDIALSVGFESLATFNRIFKQQTGVTPSEYRESKRSQHHC